MGGPLSAVFGENAEVLDDSTFRLLLLVNVGAPLGTSLLSPMLSTLTGQYGVSEATIGLMMTVYTAASIVLIPLAGALSDRVGRKPILLAGLVLFGGAGGALAFTTDFRVVLALRFLQGVGFAGLTPVIVTSIGDIFDAGEEATAQGIRFSASGVSLLVFPPLAGVLVAVAWNLPFLLYCIPLPVALIVWRYFEEPSRSTTTEPDAASSGGTRALLREAVRPRVAAVLVGRAVPNFLYVTFLTYNSFLVVRALDGSPGAAGVVVAAVSVAQAAVATQTGRITRLFESRFWPLAGATIAMAAGLTVIGLAPSFPVVLLGGVTMGVGFGVSLSLYRSVITGFSAEFRGGLVSLGASLGRVSATAAPIVVGASVAAFKGSLGFVPAVRWTIAAAAAASLVVGLASLLVAKLSPPVDRGESVDGVSGS